MKYVARPWVAVFMCAAAGACSDEPASTAADAPTGGAQFAADVARRDLVADGLGVAVEVARLRQAQQQPIGLQLHGQNALMPVSSRPITSWCTVSVPS